MHIVRTIVTIALLSILLPAQEPAGRSAGSDLTHEQYRLLVKLATCNTEHCLVNNRQQLPTSSKLADIVFFSRKMQVSPSRDAASGLLLAIPANENEQVAFINFCGWQDGLTDSVHDIEVLGLVYARWPKLVAKAAILRPDMLPIYVRYLPLATNDIHSDFTGHAELVCRKNRATFNRAFAALPQDDQAFIRKVVFAPVACRAIFRSEAD